MMLIRLNAGLLRRVGLPRLYVPAPSSRSSSGNGARCDDEPPYRRIIGSREIVCHGLSGEPMYIDAWDMPFPAIRYRECTPELMALREKERGDWRKLTIDEKKCLYRASFRQTFAEMLAPNTSEWKCILGVLLMSYSLALWIFLFYQHKVSSDWPDSFNPENRIAQYYFQVDINNQPFSGNYRPPGAELRVHPKNKEMLQKMAEAEAAASAAEMPPSE